jgi:hypothetical protein
MANPAARVIAFVAMRSSANLKNSIIFQLPHGLDL